MRRSFLYLILFLLSFPSFFFFLTNVFLVDVLVRNDFTKPGSSYGYTRPLHCQSYRNYIRLRLRCSEMDSSGSLGLYATFLRLFTINNGQTKVLITKIHVLTAIRTWYTEISARGLISSPVPGLLIGKLVQSGRAEGTRDGVAGYAVRRQVGRLGYLMRILRLGQFGHETGVLPVEVDEDERAEDHDANEAVSPERGSCPCFRKFSSPPTIPFYLYYITNNNLSSRIDIEFLSFFVNEERMEVAHRKHLRTCHRSQPRIPCQDRDGFLEEHLARSCAVAEACCERCSCNTPPRPRRGLSLG